ncbi:hypothetical protein FTX61_00785 [Nitriliruptoraceae bacterium ZYF776]|nr:hypothetical protein [Profundirhabdus halotolerans]
MTRPDEPARSALEGEPGEASSPRGRLFDRERGFLRDRNHETWALGFLPGRAARWGFRHPVLVGAITFVLFAALCLPLVLGGRPETFVRAVVYVVGMPPLAWWYARTQGRQYAEWRAEDPQRVAELEHRAAELGFWERVDGHNQLQSEREMAAGDDHGAAWSPVSRRLYAVVGVVVIGGFALSLLGAILAAVVGS